MYNSEYVCVCVCLASKIKKYFVGSWKLFVISHSKIEFFKKGTIIRG